MFFDPLAFLKKNSTYEIEALISGPNSSFGCHGIGTVKVSDVTFTFSNVNSNRTTTKYGQFPEILFSVY